MITLTEPHWNKLKQGLKADYGNAIVLLREKMKEEVGCTVRYGNYGQYPSRKIFLDFFDDSKETFFMLKYMNYD